MGTSRREFLRRLSGGVLLAASPGLASPRPPSLQGNVVRPGDPGYDDARADYNARFDVFPQAVLFASSAREVAAGVLWARKRGVPFRARSGRHSYEAYSLVQDGLVIDVSAMNQVQLDAGRLTARIGAGAGLLDLYTTLAAQGVTLPGGSCPTVGIAGLTLGGGFGLLARSRGLTCDSLLEIEVVTAEGRLVRANRHHHPELFWAHQGGGGGNFGLVTELVFAVCPVGEVAIYSVEWPFAQLGEVLDFWQGWAPGVDPRLASILRLQGGGQPLSSAGQFVGSADELRTLLAPLLAVGSPEHISVTQWPYLEAVRIFAGLNPTMAHLALGLSLDHARFKNTSAYASAPFDSAALRVIADQLAAAPGPENVLQLDSYGGAVGEVPPRATAFFHRSALFSLQYQAYWTLDADAAPNIAWVTAFREALSPFTQGAYVNYIDADLPDFLQAYYGENLRELQQVKRRWDPDDAFRFPQSIPPLQR